MKFYEAVEKFVKESFAKLGKEYEIPHFSRTVYWMKILRPDAYEAMQIAAMAHDIERAFRLPDVAGRKRELKGKFTFNDPGYIGPHQERGGEIIEKFLRENGADEIMIAKCKGLIAKHEEGGDEDQNLLKDADSISFFENNIATTITNNVSEVGRESVKGKIDWMYNRITSEKAKELCKGWYEAAVKKLEESEI